MKKIYKLFLTALIVLLLMGVLLPKAAYAMEVPPTDIFWNPEDGVVEDIWSEEALPPTDDYLDADNLPPSLLRIGHNVWRFRNGHYFFYVNNFPHQGWVRCGSQWFFLNPTKIGSTRSYR